LVLAKQGVTREDDLVKSEMSFIGRGMWASNGGARLRGSASQMAASLNLWHFVLLLGTIVLSVQPLTCFSATSLPGCDSKQVFQEADALLKRRLYSQAKVELKQLASCKNLSPMDRFNLGWFYGRTHDFDAAIKIFSSLSPDVPDRQTHKYAIALTQFELADYKGTVETLRTQPGQSPLPAESANLLAVTYAKLGSYQEAYAVLREELTRDRSDRLAYLNLVTLLCDEEKFSDAADVASEAVTAFPKDSEVLVVRGAAYALLGEVAKSQADFEAAIRISPTHAAPRFFLAVSDYKQGKYAAVADELTAAIHSGVKDSDLHYLLAEAKLRLDPGNLEEPMQELDRAIELNGRSVSARSLRGKLLLQEHHVQAAVVDLEYARSIDPDSRSATYNLARAYFSIGKKKEANDLFGKLTEQPVDPVDEMSNRRLKDTLRGESMLQP
jgi:tetratricopeptide (TPR) repeat protein